MIALVDYGMGNLRSVEKALVRAGGNVRVVSGPEGVAAADALVVPGVGAFGDCLKNLAALHLVDAIRQFVAGPRPFLGICLGFQALFESSEEAPGVTGLGVLAGTVPRVRADGRKVPHMGWNTLRIRQPSCPLLQGVQDGSFVYFVHSYYCQPREAGLVCTSTEYGVEFCSMLWSGNVFATQFHPEKSQAVGLTILENFVGLAKTGN
jgi:imidazole glycerol-phosphate synthase subunit HisH